MVSQHTCPTCGSTKQRFTAHSTILMDHGNVLYSMCDDAWHIPATEIKPDSTTIGIKDTQ